MTSCIHSIQHFDTQLLLWASDGPDGCGARGRVRKETMKHEQVNGWTQHADTSKVSGERKCESVAHTRAPFTKCPQWPLTWAWPSSWPVCRLLLLLLGGFDSVERIFFSSAPRSLMHCRRPAQLSCCESSDWSWARSMEPNRVIDSGRGGQNRVKEQFLCEIREECENLF